MPSKKYTTIEKIQNYLLIDIDAGFEPQVEEWIENMSDYIEGMTSRAFIADGTTSIKLYEVVAKNTDTIGSYVSSVVDLRIDDCVEVESVTIDDVAVAPGDFFVYPANGLPKTRIHLKADSGVIFSQGEQNLKVSADWGYSVAAPGDIVFACTVLVAGIINNSWSSEGEVKSISMGAYNLTFKDEKSLSDFERVEEILKVYKRVDV